MSTNEDIGRVLQADARKRWSQKRANQINQTTTNTKQLRVPEKDAAKTPLTVAQQLFKLGCSPLLIQPKWVIQPKWDKLYSTVSLWTSPPIITPSCSGIASVKPSCSDEPVKHLCL